MFAYKCSYYYNQCNGEKLLNLVSPQAKKLLTEAFLNFTVDRPFDEPVIVSKILDFDSVVDMFNSLVAHKVDWESFEFPTNHATIVYFERGFTGSNQKAGIFGTANDILNFILLDRPFEQYELRALTDSIELFTKCCTCVRNGTGSIQSQTFYCFTNYDFANELLKLAWSMNEDDGINTLNFCDAILKVIPNLK